MGPIVAVATSAPHQDPPSYSMLFSPAASSLASVGGAEVVELEVHWDPTFIRSELMRAASILSHRGLKLAAKWAAEQALGIPSGRPGSLTDREQETQQQQPSSSSPFWRTEWTQLSEKDWYAKTLLDLGENFHAASVLSQPTTDVTHIKGPLPNLGTFGTYLRAYALYLAGERRKEEEYLELQRCVLNYRVR
jgi:anaphase-promoting complex subunit 8